jgi:hypothetical protein
MSQTKIPISSTLYRGERITSLDEIVRLTNERKSVYHLNWGRKPASVLLHMQLKSIADAIKFGYLYYVTS